MPNSAPFAVPHSDRDGGFFTRIWAWFFRGDALRRAEDSVERQRGSAQGAYLRQAELAFELGERARDPIDALRAGNAVHLAVGLYRQAAYFALAAHGAVASPHPSDAHAAFAAVDPELLRYAAASDAELARIRTLVLERSFLDDARESAPQSLADADSLRAFVRALLERRPQPERIVERVLAQRLMRIGGVLVLATVCAALAPTLVDRATRSEDLAAHKPWRASSKLTDCDPGQAVCAGKHTRIVFHTLEEEDPWFEVDLGGPKRFSRIDVDNRSDCCPDRALPLVLEASDDQTHFRPLARRDEPFGHWTARFAPTTARYVRARVHRRSILHLEGLAVRAQ